MQHLLPESIMFLYSDIRNKRIINKKIIFIVFSYFSLWFKSVLLFIGNFFAWLTNENNSCWIDDLRFSIWFWLKFPDEFDTEWKSLITGWTNANGFFVDFDGEKFSIFDCDIDNDGLFKLEWGFIGYDTSDV